ncbi:MAG: hypothetical protein P0Y55_14055 [Candidatus Cohnella colombiensis]|uniref:Uncharacterized protein n=1 Tax=Candidatus Cohnella colombiensis TaxID=3121368 RepID=A0AA95J9V8_9BACL|nr:MAG: hypothetical protein P0Y55_14055 [Cohnella sp.]
MPPTEQEMNEALRKAPFRERMFTSQHMEAVEIKLQADQRKQTKPSRRIWGIVLGSGIVAVIVGFVLFVGIERPNSNEQTVSGNLLVAADEDNDIASPESSQEPSQEPLKQPSPEPTPIETPLTPAQQQATDMWNSIGFVDVRYHPVNERMENVTLDQLLILTKHPDKDVRWYCAYRIIEFDSPEHHDVVLGIVDELLQDPEHLVAEAASFSNKVMLKSFDADPRFIRSPDGNTYTFVKFEEATYNDGTVWIARDGRVEKLYSVQGAFIYDLFWSPNSKWLYARYGGRTWNTFMWIDIRSGEIFDLTDIEQQIMDDPDNGYLIDHEQYGRFDYETSIVEWSPDSKRFLFHYNISHDDTYGYTGFGVYNLSSKKVEKVIRQTGGQYSTERLEDFTWEE